MEVNGQIHARPALKMEAICSSETSADFQWTTWRYIPEDIILQLFVKISQIEFEDHLSNGLRTEGRSETD
jgi:hypothetical protein